MYEIFSVFNVFSKNYFHFMSIERLFDDYILCQLIFIFSIYFIEEIQ